MNSDAMNSDRMPPDSMQPDPADAPAEPSADATDDGNADGSTKPDSMTDSSEPDAATIQANEKQIELVQQSIREGKWAEMKPSAQALETLPLTSAQRERAAALYDIADLASFYHGAIRRGLATLKTGSTFEYVKGLNVIVVEVGDDALTIQFDRKSKSFSIDAMPPRLTAKIAGFALSPDRPDAIAGQALYRLIRSDLNPEYRNQALTNLASVDGQLDQVDTERLQRVTKEIFSL